MSCLQRWQFYVPHTNMHKLCYNLWKLRFQILTNKNNNNCCVMFVDDDDDDDVEMIRMR